MPERLDRETKKEVAKIGMTLCLGVTVLTAPLLKGNKTMKNVHTGAGLALTAFSLWHHFLYQADKKKNIKKTKAQAVAATTKTSPPAASPHEGSQTV